MKLEKIETHYHAQLKVSEYDYLDVVSDEGGRITIKFLETRWRTPEETIEMLRDIIGMLSQLDRDEFAPKENKS